MEFASFGVKFMDPESGKLLLPKAEMKEAFEWFAGTPRTASPRPNNTAMSWDEIQGALQDRKGLHLSSGRLGGEGVPARRGKGATWPTDKDGYLHKIGWFLAGGGQGRRAQEPLAPDRLRREPEVDARPARGHARGLCDAALLQHPARRLTAHTAILNGQRSMPEYKAAWYLHAAMPMLARSTFIPNNPDFGRYNGILFKALQGVETGRLSPGRGGRFLEDEMTNELGDKLRSSTR